MTTPSAPDPYHSPDPQPGSPPGYPAPGGGYPTQGVPAPQSGYPTQGGYPAQGGYPQGGDWSAPPGAYPSPATGLPAATGKRPGFLTAAAVLAFIIGGLGIIFSLLAFTVLNTIDAAGFYTVLLILVILADVGLVWGGVQALGGKEGRILVAAAGALIVINLISMIVYFSAQSLLSFVIPILIIAFMVQATSKQWLDGQGAPHF